MFLPLDLLRFCCGLFVTMESESINLQERYCKMMILVLDNNSERREKTADMLRRVYPNCSLVTQGDPLAAVQFVYYNPVDFVITALNMRPMDGLKYIETARKVKTKAKMILLASEDEMNDFMVCDDEADGFLSDPLTEQEIRAVLSGTSVSM